MTKSFIIVTPNVVLIRISIVIFVNIRVSFIMPLKRGPYDF